MLDGMYSIIFRGRADWGNGMMILQRGVITGADAHGVLYDGSYAEVGTDLHVDFTMTVPPGVTLVQGTPAQAEQYTISARAIMPTRALDTGEPALMELPPRPADAPTRARSARAS